MSDVTLRRPELRTCEQCGRRERWDPEHRGWVVATEGTSAVVGDVYCIHEWDINGTFSTVDEG
jgi:hypothetical protein